mmetsp:Transcript_6625/g.19342  ORF Transcript_6625/g.19342 Transcript_6625/m.19342 type:complete len:206 (-) Transcript_6625:613-1230(-)
MLDREGVQGTESFLPTMAAKEPVGSTQDGQHRAHALELSFHSYSAEHAAVPGAVLCVPGIRFVHVLASMWCLSKTVWSGGPTCGLFIRGSREELPPGQRCSGQRVHVAAVASPRGRRGYPPTSSRHRSDRTDPTAKADGGARERVSAREGPGHSGRNARREPATALRARRWWRRRRHQRRGGCRAGSSRARWCRQGWGRRRCVEV